MEVIYKLIPGMIIAGLIMVGVLIWAVKRGQYDDLEGDAHRILLDEDDDKMPSKNGESAEETEKAKRRADPNWPDAD